MKSLVCMTILGVLVGCSVATEDAAGEAPAGGEEFNTATHRLLASVDTPSSTIYFEELTTSDGTSVLAVSETASAFIARTPLDRLIEDHSLTKLEMFLAVSDEPAPEELVVAHEEEAGELERENSEVMNIDFDVDAPVEKTATACTNWVHGGGAPPGWGRYSFLHPRSRNNMNSSGMFWMSMGTTSGTNPPNDWNYATARYTALGFCNASAAGSNMTGQIAWMRSNSGTWSYSAETTLSPGWRHRYAPFRTNYVDCSAGFCITTPTRYGVAGRGTNFYLRTAEYEPIIR